MITIKSLRNERPKNTWDVKVDRSSILGNPFLMRDEALRNHVCDLYKEYFDKKESISFKNELSRLAQIHKKYNKLNLFCWCAPRRCHADTIKEFLEEVQICK